MPSAITRTKPNRAPRNKNPQANRPQPTAPISIVSATKSVAVLTVVFNQPVAVKGVPQYTTNLAGITPLSVASVNTTTIAITFSASIATATTLNIPYEEANIRNASGGFVKDSTFPVA